MSIRKFAREVLLTAICLLAAGPAAAGTVAGEIILAVGQAWIVSGDKSEEAKRGRTVMVNDRVVTRSGGHAHVRLRDGGLVAVRPNSSLHIEVFEYDPALPASGRVRYVLSEGVARSITGGIGEANKSGFRFNTPVAGIGVRGTDFVVRHSGGTTQVTVNSGEVVVGALGETCRAEAFGACGGTALPLAASAARAMIEVAVREGVPQLRRIEKGTSNTPDLVTPPHPAEPGGTPGSKGTQQKSGATVASPEMAGGTGSPRALVSWGRWSGTVTGDDLKTVSELRTEGKTIVLANRIFGLSVDSLPERLPDQGLASFNVLQSSAYLIDMNGLIPASVTGGTLDVNFGASEFATYLQVAADNETFSILAKGSVDRKGRMKSNPNKSNAHVVGVLDGSLKEAGMLFDQRQKDGRELTGAVRWRRRD